MTTPKILSKSAQIIQNILAQKGIHLTVVQVPESTRTTQRQLQPLDALRPDR